MKKGRDAFSRTHFAFSLPTESRSCFVGVASLSQDMYGFAIELRQLAYTMPGGHEDPLIHLSERMVRCAGEQAAEQQLEGDRANQARAFT